MDLDTKDKELKDLYQKHRVDAEAGVRNFVDIKCDIITCKRIAEYYGRVNDIFDTIYFVPHTIKLCEMHKETLCKENLARIPYIDDSLRLVCQKCGHVWIPRGDSGTKLPRSCPACDSWAWRGIVK